MAFIRPQQEKLDEGHTRMLILQNELIRLTQENTVAWQEILTKKNLGNFFQTLSKWHENKGNSTSQKSLTCV